MGKVSSKAGNSPLNSLSSKNWNFSPSGSYVFKADMMSTS